MMMILYHCKMSLVCVGEHIHFFLHYKTLNNKCIEYIKYCYCSDLTIIRILRHVSWSVRCLISVCVCVCVCDVSEARAATPQRDITIVWMRTLRGEITTWTWLGLRTTPLGLKVGRSCRKYRVCSTL